MHCNQRGVWNYFKYLLDLQYKSQLKLGIISTEVHTLIKSTFSCTLRATYLEIYYIPVITFYWMHFSTQHTTYEISHQQTENVLITSLMMLLTSSTTKAVYKRKSRILNNQWTHSSVYYVRALLRTCTRNLIYACQISGKSEDTKSAFICIYMYSSSFCPVKLTFLEM